MGSYGRYRVYSDEEASYTIVQPLSTVLQLPHRCSYKLHVTVSCILRSSQARWGYGEVHFTPREWVSVYGNLRNESTG